MTLHRIQFGELEKKGYPALKLQSGENLSVACDIENSPLLFGCRAGICGTCLCEVRSLTGKPLPDISLEESEVLAILAPDNPQARLACQLHVSDDWEIVPLA